MLDAAAGAVDVVGVGEHRAVFIREQADLLERDRLETGEVLEDFRVGLEPEVAALEVHETGILVVNGEWSAGEGIGGALLAVGHVAPGEGRLAAHGDVVGDEAFRGLRADELVAEVRVDRDVVLAVDGLGELGLVADFVEEAGAAFPLALEAGDVAEDGDVRMVVIEVDRVAVVARVDVVEADDVVAELEVAVVAVDAAHVVRDHGEAEDLVVFDHVVVAAEQDPGVRCVVDEVVRDSHAHAGVVAAVAAAGEADVHARGVDALEFGEVVDVVVHDHVAGRGAGVGGDVAPGEEDAAGAEFGQLAAAHGVILPALDPHAVFVDEAHGAAGDHVPLPALDAEAGPGVDRDEQAAQGDV